MDNKLDYEKYQFELSVREKRISAVFKALCIVASFAGVIFLQMDTSGILDTFGVLYSCLLAFLLPLMVCMLVYIVNDAECFLPKHDDLTTELSNNAQQSYNNIFRCLRFSGVTSLVVLVLFLSKLEFWPAIELPMEIISAVILILWLALCSFLHNPRIRSNVHFVFSSLTIICIFVSVCVFNK